MTFAVEMSHRAKQNLADITTWILDRSAIGASRWLQAFEKAIERLAVSPLSFSVADEAPDFSEPIRQIFFHTPKGRNYRIVFRVDGSSVIVLSIRGSGQAPIRPRDLSD